MTVASITDILQQFEPEAVETTNSSLATGYEEITVTHYSYVNGGPSQYFNKAAYLKAQDFHATGADGDSLVIGVNQYLNDEPATHIFFTSEELQSQTSIVDGNETIAQVSTTEILDNIETIGYLPSLMFRGFSKKFKFINEKGAKTTLSLDEVTNKKIQDWIIDVVEKDELEQKLGGLPIMSYVVANGFAYADILEKVANDVQAKINNLEEIQININTDSGATFFNEVSTLFSLEIVEEDGKSFFKIEQDFGIQEDVKIDISRLGPEWLGEFEIPGVAARQGIIGISEPLVEAFPTSVYEDNEDALDILRNDVTLVGKDISSYEFKFYTEQYIVAGETLDFTRYFNLGNSKTVSTSELIGIKTKAQYSQFIVSLLSDAEDGDQDTATNDAYDAIFNNQTRSFTREMYVHVATDKELARRIEIFMELAKAVDELDPTGNDTVPIDQYKKIQAAGAKAFTTAKIDPPTKPSDEDIKNRQKYFKQCALMLNMPTLKKVYTEKIKSIYSGSIPYNGRFLTAYSSGGDQEMLISNLISSANEQVLFQLKPYQMTQLTPKIRLFKVYEQAGAGEIKEVEFLFDRQMTLSRDKVQGREYTSPATNFMSAEFDKGSGVGLKEFSFEFNGTTVAESRNDIKATLKMFFQTFSDFTRYRQGYGKDKYRFVDLIIQPTPDEKQNSFGISVSHDRQYEPQFYRVRAEVGYYIPDQSNKDFTDAERKALRISNKSFFLTMVDHDISFNKDGSVSMSITYRAYLEAALKHPRLDALASPALIAKREKNSKLLAEQYANKECTVEQLKELQLALQAQEAIILRQSLSSILKRLRTRNVLYTVAIKLKHKEQFLDDGFFRKCDFIESAGEADANTSDLKVVLDSRLPEKSEDFNFIDSKDQSVQFFFFGDLLYTILDCIYDKKDKPRVGFKNNSILLGSFEFEPFQQSATNSDKVYNIAQLPISVDFFSRWFVDNITSQKSTRKSFPVLNFIRNLSSSLIKPSLIENCVNRKVEKKLRFQTGQVTAYTPTGKNPLLTSSAKALATGNGMMDTSTLRTSGVLPLQGGPEKDASNVNNYHNFIVLSAIGSSLSFAGSGNYEEDIKQGRFHVHVGQDSGLVKTISLSKSDQQYIREARFFQNGIDGLLQLSAVYVANLEMFGNTLFYPGMEFFFNPYGLGMLENSTVKNSIANKLGVGGYHTIISVKSTISPGKFTTSVSGQQYFSGAAEDLPEANKKNGTSKLMPIEEYVPNDDPDGKGKAACKTILLDALNYDFEEGATAASATPTATPTGATAATATGAPEAIETANTADAPEETAESDSAVVASEEMTPEQDTQDADTTEEASTEQESNEAVITDESQNAKPEARETYAGVLKTIQSSQTSTSTSGGQFTQAFTEEGGRVTEMTDGTLYFQTIDGRGGLGVKQKITNHSRISKR